MICSFIIFVYHVNDVFIYKTDGMISQKIQVKYHRIVQHQINTRTPNWRRNMPGDRNSATARKFTTAVTTTSLLSEAAGLCSVLMDNGPN